MTTLKTCFKCGAEKPISEFYRHPYMGDGRLGKCKCCTKADVKANRSANSDYYMEYDRARASLPHRAELRKRINERWAALFPERKRATQAVNNAIRDGRLERLPCWVCGAEAEAHHPDYSMPLDVIWLCPLHHKRLHAMARESA